MFEVPRAGVSWCWSARAVSFLARAAMGACVSRREACPSASASPVASAIADFAAGARTERRDAGRDPARGGFGLPEGEGEGARASGSGSGSRDADADADAGALTASLLALKAARDGDDVVARREEEEEEDEWCSARSESSSKSWASDASSHPRDPAPRPDLAREQPRAPRPEHRADENVHPDLDQDDPHAEAWRELEVATAHLEADAVDRLAGESDGLDGPDRPHARSRDRSGGAFARLARVGEGMRVLRSVSRAARRAGGTLDLTSFAGTPIRWHAPHSALLTHARAESPSASSPREIETEPRTDHSGRSVDAAAASETRPVARARRPSFRATSREFRNPRVGTTRRRSHDERILPARRAHARGTHVGDRPRDFSGRRAGGASSQTVQPGVGRDGETRPRVRGRRRGSFQRWNRCRTTRRSPRSIRAGMDSRCSVISARRRD